MIKKVDNIYKIIDDCKKDREKIAAYFPDFETCENYSIYQYADKSKDEKLELCTGDGFLSLDIFTFSNNQPVDSFGL